MDNIKNDAYYIAKIIKDIDFVIKNMSGVSAEDFSKNEILQDSMMFRLIQISENAKKLSDTYKMQHGEIPWTDVYGLRNKIVHEYGRVDLGIVYDTLVNDIPEVRKLLAE